MAGTFVAAMIFSKVNDGNTAGDVGPEEFIYIEMPDKERLYRDALVKPFQSAYWFYYPDIPTEVKSGALATINAPVYGFIKWEKDDRFADVEFVEEYVEGDFAYLSFIMPIDDFAIRALYEEILFYDDNVDIDFSGLSELLEPGEGALDISGASASIAPMSVEIPPPSMPTGMVGQPYEARIPALPSGMEWLEDAFQRIPTGWEFTVNAFNTGGVITNTTPILAPGIVGGPGGFVLRVDTKAMETVEDINDPGTYITRPVVPAVIEEIPIIITILPAITFPQASLPDGMLGVDYEIAITTANLPENVQLWRWGVDEVKTPLPPGLSIDINTGVISGIPTSGAAGQTFTFVVTLTSFDTTAIAYAEKEFSIKTWQHPQLLKREDLPDGMVGQPYRWETDIEFLNLPDPGDPYWTWVFTNLPPGVNFVYDEEEIDDDVFEKYIKFLSTSTTAGAQGTPSRAGEYDITVTLRPTVPNSNVATITQEYSIKIWDRPVFITEQKDLPEAMDHNRRYKDDEPEDDEYEAIIEALYPEGMTFNWDWTVDDDLKENTNLDMLYSPAINNAAAVIHGKPEPKDGSKTYQFSIEMEANVPLNKNIDGAVISRVFDIRIWERRYLYIEIENTVGFVIRKGEDDVAGWHRQNWDREPGAALYRERRAVMPGTQGVMRSLVGISGFIRWEVIAGKDHGPVQIGGPTNYWTEGLHSYVQITMPTNTDGDVYIRGYHTRVPVVSSSLAEGTVNVPYGGVINIAQDDIGFGAGSLRWEVLEGDNIYRPNMPLPGLVLDVNAGRINGVTGIPEEEGTFRFKIGLTLPGSMRIERDFSILIHPVPGVLLGDVNGDGHVNLADLILLARYLQGEAGIEIDEEAADLNGNGQVDIQDLRILALFFARPAASLR